MFLFVNFIVFLKHNHYVFWFHSFYYNDVVFLQVKLVLVRVIEIFKGFGNVNVSVMCSIHLYMIGRHILVEFV